MRRPATAPPWPWPEDRALAECLHIATLNVEQRARKEVGPDGPGGRGISEESWCRQIAGWWDKEVHANRLLREADPVLTEEWGSLLVVEEGVYAYARAQETARRTRLLRDRVDARRSTRALYLDEWDDAIEILDRVDPVQACAR